MSSTTGELSAAARSSSSKAASCTGETAEGWSAGAESTAPARSRAVLIASRRVIGPNGPTGPSGVFKGELMVRERSRRMPDWLAVILQSALTLVVLVLVIMALAALFMIIFGIATGIDDQITE